MARPLDDEEDKPLDPAVEKVRRKLVRFVAINLGLLLFALMAVGLAIVYKTRTAPPPPVAAGDIPSPEGVAEGTIALPVGASIVSQSLAGNRLSLEVTLADGGRAILIYDLSQKRLVGRYAVTAQ